MGEIVLELKGLDCASCASKIEKLTQNIDGVDDVNLDFVSNTLRVKLMDSNLSEMVIGEIKDIVGRLEPDVVISQRDEETHDHGNIDREGIVKIIVAGVLFIMPLLFKLEGMPRFAIYAVAYLVIGADILMRAARNVMAGQPFDEYFLMSIATIGAFIIREYPEGVAVMLFYQIGELFQGMAVNHSRRSISSLLDIRPDYANLDRDGKIDIVDPRDVHIGDHIIVKPGEKVPLDGLIVEGSSSFDTSNITGESLPRTAVEGDRILSGFVNNEGLIRVQVEKEFGESTVSKILDLVENASSKKAPTENFITKFARYYTPVVVFTALAIGLIPPLFFGLDMRDWAYRAFVFLVISCPCALVISIPLGFFGGIGGASKKGILIKGGNYLEGLNDIDTIVLDKTGTITKGIFKVTDIDVYDELSKDAILELAAHGEAYSNHPIAVSIMEAYGGEVDKNRITDYLEIAGKGIKVKIDGQEVLLGNRQLLEDHAIDVQESQGIGTIIHIGMNKVHMGTIIVSDELKDGVAESIEDMKSLGIQRTIMLSGDNSDIAKKVGELVAVDEVYGDLLPQDKVEIFERIMEESKGKVAFVGDGVNDAPVLARADIGIAMGGLGSDAAIEASDIVIMTDEIGKIATGLKISKNTKKIVTQNILFALGIKLIVLGLGAFGIATMWEAVFADVGVSIIAILNSIRALRI
ncbi:MAG: cadmium-translocating P-type ATPase [Tissierellia bacterium]|nr:cadmium-translocating P-type ATPase [Tissierellia bacterium]